MKEDYPMPQNPGSRLASPDQPQNLKGPQRDGPDPDPRHGPALLNESQPDADRMTKGRPEPRHSTESTEAPFVLTSPKKR